MVNNLIKFQVTNLAEKGGKVYFSRVVQQPAGSFDVNLVLRALAMLFRSELFKITVETYGA